MTLDSFIQPRDLICISYAHTVVLFVRFEALFTFGGGGGAPAPHVNINIICVLSIVYT